MKILLHSSKTMKVRTGPGKPRLPEFIGEAQELAAHVRSLSEPEIAKCMKISSKKAAEVRQLFRDWRPDSDLTTAIDCFVGDIYSGMQAGELNEQDREYADDVLRILSGLYGSLRPLDGIAPYRLELAYKLPGYPDLYGFWGDKLAKTIDGDELVVNLTSKEYGKAILHHLNNKVIEPRFLTLNKNTGKPEFLVVHAKIARGAYAHWLIRNRVSNPDDLMKFDKLGYAYDASLSTSDTPVFVTSKFGGLGLSVRLR